MATKKTVTYGASLTKAERREWNRKTDMLLKARWAAMKAATKGLRHAS